MKLDGVWGIEVAGLDGWERISTALLQDGRYFAANENYYATGNYKVKKDQYSGKFRVNQYGTARAMFGSKAKQVDLEVKGKMTKKGEIIARAYPRYGDNLGVNIRMTRLEKLK